MIVDITGREIKLNDVVSVPLHYNGRAAVGIVKEMLPTGAIVVRVITPNEVCMLSMRHFEFPSEQLAILNIELDSNNQLHSIIAKERNSL